MSQWEKSIRHQIDLISDQYEQKLPTSKLIHIGDRDGDAGCYHAGMGPEVQSEFDPEQHEALDTLAKRLYDTLPAFLQVLLDQLNHGIGTFNGADGAGSREQEFRDRARAGTLIQRDMFGHVVRWQ